MPEIVRQTYELGGPHVYSIDDIIVIFKNYIERPPKRSSIYILPKELALDIGSL
jgi:NADH dehydrogenase (ubiquinone) 1 alpha subcomplex subunit 9